jgi:hypothetical protein
MMREEAEVGSPQLNYVAGAGKGTARILAGPPAL